MTPAGPAGPAAAWGLRALSLLPRSRFSLPPPHFLLPALPPVLPPRAARSPACDWDLTSDSHTASTDGIQTARATCTAGAAAGLALSGPFTRADGCSYAAAGGNGTTGQYQLVREYAGVHLAFGAACSAYWYPGGYRLAATNASLTLRSVTLGWRSEGAALPLALRLSPPPGGGGAAVEVEVGAKSGMPAEVLGAYTFPLPAGGFTVQRGVEGYTIELVGPQAGPLGYVGLKGLYGELAQAG